MKQQVSGNNSVVCWRTFFMLLVLIFAIYGNSLKADWHLDDYGNILYNPKIKITEITSTTLTQTFFASIDGGRYSSNQLYRPLPVLTFALNWYLGKDDVFGYHLANISIHFLTAFFLFLSILWLYKTPRLRSLPAAEDSYTVAFFATVLWAVNPVQTQAVTYIVQRMASMAAMFYIIGIYLYLRGRLTDSIRVKIGWLLGCLAAFLCALGSKENTITFPLAILLLEFMFFQDLTKAKVRGIFIKIMLLAGFALMIVGIWFFLHGDLSKILGKYTERNFTLVERLLTESRIVIFYLSLLFYPAPTRLSIAHDVTVSTSLIHPWTTLPSIALIFLLIAFAIFMIKKRPILSYAILFFFLNHVIESTFVPLELIFEHRNYLPSLFLFLPVAVFIINLTNAYKEKQAWIYASLIIFMILLVAGWGIGSRVRNMAWATEKTLWEDAMRKAPNNARPYTSLATKYYKRIGNYNKALVLYRESLTKNMHHSAVKAMTLHNIAVVYIDQKKYADAIRVWTDVVNADPDQELFRYGLATAYADIKDWDKANEQIDVLLNKRLDYPEYNFLKGSILIEKGQLDAAIFFY